MDSSVAVITDLLGKMFWCLTGKCITSTACMFLFFFILPGSPIEIKKNRFYKTDLAKVAAIQNHNVLKCNIYNRDSREKLQSTFNGENATRDFLNFFISDQMAVQKALHNDRIYKTHTHKQNKQKQNSNMLKQDSYLDHPIWGIEQCQTFDSAHIEQHSQHFVC